MKSEKNDKKRHHILFVSSWYPNSTNPTLGNFVQKHAEAASAHNTISALAVFPRDQKHKIEVETSEKNGVYSAVCYIKPVTNSIPFISGLIKKLRYFKACKKGLQKIELEQGEVNLTHLNVVLPMGIFAHYLKRFRKIPYVVTEHSTAYTSGDLKYTDDQINKASEILKDAEIILPVSQDLGKTLQQLAPEVPQIVVANVVDEETFLLKKTNDQAKKRFIHISTAVDDHKNVSGILEGIQKLSQQREDFESVIVSDGDVDPHIKKAEELGILNRFVKFEGRKATEEIAQLLSESTALVLFSNYENFPCVIAESMMVGTPIISTAVNGIPEHVSTQNGILVQPKDVDALVDAFNHVLDHSDKFSPNNLRNYALKHFSYSGVGDQLDAIYRQLLENK